MADFLIISPKFVHIGYLTGDFSVKYHLRQILRTSKNEGVRNIYFKISLHFGKKGSPNFTKIKDLIKNNF